MGKICVVIPAYNEEVRVGAVVTAVLDRLPDVVVIDDGSADDTAGAAGKAGAVVLVHEVNKGKGAALATGLAWARAHGFVAAVTVDADGQHDPADIPRLVAAFHKRNADIVVGTRMYDRRGMPLVRALTNLVTSVVVSCIAGARITDSQSGFRLLRSATAGALTIKAARFDMESEMLVKAARSGLVIAEAPITTIYRDEKSKINPLLDTCRFVLMALRLIFVERQGYP